MLTGMLTTQFTFEVLLISVSLSHSPSPPLIPFCWRCQCRRLRSHHIQYTFCTLPIPSSVRACNFRVSDTISSATIYTHHRCTFQFYCVLLKPFRKSTQGYVNVVTPFDMYYVCIIWCYVYKVEGVRVHSTQLDPSNLNHAVCECMCVRLQNIIIIIINSCYHFPFMTVLPTRSAIQ